MDLKYSPIGCVQNKLLYKEIVLHNPRGHYVAQLFSLYFWCCKYLAKKTKKC